MNLRWAKVGLLEILRVLASQILNLGPSEIACWPDPAIWGTDEFSSIQIVSSVRFFQISGKAKASPEQYLRISGMAKASPEQYLRISEKAKSSPETYLKILWELNPPSSLRGNCKLWPGEPSKSKIY